jgi:ubiquinone/menaquinone biosynthesis C-methylase UbiE
LSDATSILDPDIWQATQERQRAMLQLFARLGWRDLAMRRVLEVGCGTGENLLEFLRIGFRPRNLVGIESQADRFAQAMQRLPSGVTLMQGDAPLVKLPDESEDIVYQSGVFSALLDAPFQWRLAQTMWRWVRPGGGVLWYDVAVARPGSPGVRGVSVARLRELFPQGRVEHRRLTLSAPIARRVCRWHPVLYSYLNTLPALRTHLLAWIEKPNS